MLTLRIGSAVRLDRVYFGRWAGGGISEPAFAIAPVKEVAPNPPVINSVELLENAPGTIKVKLTLPSTNTDGSPLALGELVRLRIKYGPASNDLRYENDFPPGEEISFAPGMSGQIYLAAQVQDTNGNWSALSPVYAGPNIPALEEAIAFWAHRLNADAIFSNNSPQAGYISWSNVKISFRNETWEIQNGNTNKRYIWWDYSLSKTTFQTSDSPPALDLEDVLVAVNVNGTCYLYMYRPMISADFLRAGVLQSANWGANQGSQFDLNNGTFRLGGSSAPKLSWDGTTLQVTGQIYVQGGQVPYSYVTGGPPADADNTATVIGAGLITTGRILLGSGGTIKAGIDGAGTSDSDIRIWAGATYENRASAPFRVTQGGALVATNVTITGTGNLTGGYLGSSSALTIQSGGLDVGSSGYIKGGATGYNQGSGFWLGYDAGTYKLFIGNSAGQKLTWDGSALTVYGTIQAVGGYLGDSSAISIQSGGLDVGTTGWIRGGKTGYGSGTGFWIGYSGGTYKLDIGSSSKYMRWDGSTLTVKGTVYVDAGSVPGNLVGSGISAWNITSGTLMGIPVQGASGYPYAYFYGASVTAYQSSAYYAALLPSYLYITHAQSTIELNAQYKWLTCNYTDIFKITSSGYLQLTASGGYDLILKTSNAHVVLENVTQLRPYLAGATDLGSSSYFFQNVYAKNFVDVGCLAFVSKEVEMQDGRKLPPTKALKELRVSPNEKTPYGLPRLDYTSFPKACFVPAPRATEDTEVLVRGERKLVKKGEKLGEDGIDLSALLSVVIGAVRELEDRVTNLEREVFHVGPASN